jgi:hypothetical protein
MAGIDAHPYPAFIFYPVDDIGQVFKPVPQVRALSGSILNHGGNTACFIKSKINRFGNGLQTNFFIHFFQMRTRMKIKPVKSQLLTPLYFIKKGSTRLLQCYRIGMSQVNQVTVVR